MNTNRSLLVAALFAVAAPVVSNASFTTGYVGIDGRQTLNSGVYNGLPNPNFGRLTYLYAHVYPDTLPNNHYHGIGAWTYLGAANAAVATNSNAGNRIPETYTALPPLTLVNATPNFPAYTNRLVSLKTEEHYSDTRLLPTWDLRQYPTNTAEWFMFTSSAGTRTNSMANVKAALELVSKTTGLSIGVSTNVNMLVNPGDRLVLGEGNLWEAFPLYSVTNTAAPGTYTATLKLVDLNAVNTATNESGIFHLDFRVPEAPTLAIEDSVKITLPLVTDGYVLQWAPAANGPWTSYTNLQHTAEEIGSGETAQQTFKKFITIKRTGQQQFFRMQKP